MIDNHHVKYKEIDGMDEIVKLEHSIHSSISSKSRSSIPKQIVFRARDRLRAKQEFMFNTQIDNRAAIKERIRYNPNTGHVGYLCYWLKN